MFVPLFVLALLGQGSLAPSPFIGTWEGSLTYVDTGQTIVVVIDELVITENTDVTGSYVISGISSFKGVLTGGSLRQDRLEEVMFRPNERATANSRMDGPIEVATVDGLLTLRSKLGLKPGKGFIYRHFGHRGTPDDASYDAVLELHRKPIKGASAPSLAILFVEPIKLSPTYDDPESLNPRLNIFLFEL